MAKLPDQYPMVVNTLYNALVANAIPVQIECLIEAIGGDINLYGSNTLPVSPPTNMTEMLTGVGGLNALAYVPNYLYATTASGTPVILIAGVNVTTPAV